MKRLLYVAPHLSTGGLPQYLYKKIELLKDEFEIYLVEWVDHTGGRLVVTRNKILKVVDSSKFFTLGENKQELIDIISRVKPDIIHLEEIPEYFMDFKIAEQIYQQNRKYHIVETSHDSSFDTSQKKFFPDKFMFVSEWQIQQYKDIDIPKTVVYYPIEYVERPNREEALRALGLDPNKKHILHVGLFTPRKNQKEFFEYARFLPDYEFHCLGNQADNFQWYWEPLMENKPDNLTWWNERTDVDKFYQAMDLFLFTSRGTNTDKETMPLVIREAVSYQIPILIYNLPVYLNYWDQFDNIDYLDFKDFGYNCKSIINKLEGNEIIKSEDEVFIISTYPSHNSVVEATKKCIEGAKATGRKVILTSHLPLSKDLQELADYCVYDKNNILTNHTFYQKTWMDYDHFKVTVYLAGEGNDIYHGPAVYSNYYNGVALAEQLGFKKAYLLNYDYVLTNPEFINHVSSILNKKLAYTDVRDYPEGKVSSTFFTGVDIKFFLNTYPRISTSKDYDNLKNQFGSHSNGYENIYYHSLLPIQDKVHLESKNTWDKLIQDNFTHLNFSRVEYFTAMGTNVPESFAIYYHNSNEVDTRKVVVSIEDNGIETIIDTLTVTHKMSWYSLQSNPKKEVLVKFKVYDLETDEFLFDKQIKVDQGYIRNQLPANGYLEVK